LDLLLREPIEEAVQLLQENPLSGKEELIQALCALELEPDLARDLITFVPLVYLRYLLRNAGTRFSPTCVMRNRAGEVWTLRLSDQPVYQAAQRYAAEHFARGMAQYQIQSLIFRSAEFEEINGLLLQDVPPHDIEASTPDINVDGEEVPEGEACDGEAYDDEAAEEDSTPPTEVSKAWWEVWK
jgi:hypothetical protein